MPKAKNGDTVSVHFTGQFNDGTKFATTLGEDPLELTIGEGKLIKNFENSLIGMSEGDQKMVCLEPAEAFGEKKPELITKIARHLIPENHEDVRVGSKVQIKDKDGNTVRATVTQINDQEATIDANHPLAGETLTFKIELKKIV
jgi:peptidylprolyl isomerase